MRSPAEKRRAALALLRDGRTNGLSNRRIAEQAGVSPALVNSLRLALDREPKDRPATSGTMTPAVAAVVSGNGRWAVEPADCLAFLGSLPEASVDLVMGSPPYLDARDYGRDDIARWPEEWVEWMLGVSRAAVRVSRGLVLWVCSGVQRHGCYWPAPEGLCWEWYRGGNTLWRPCVWHKNGLPGSGGEQWLRNDWEFVITFKRVDHLPWSDPLATAAPTAHPGGFRIRPRRRGDGQRCDGGKPWQPADANPGNVVRCHAGGASRSARSAGEVSEAPYPEALVDFFVRSFCQPGGIVCDPFTGSGTTGAVALQTGRRFLGCDLRPCQVEAASIRLGTADAA